MLPRPTASKSPSVLQNCAASMGCDRVPRIWRRPARGTHPNYNSISETEKSHGQPETASSETCRPRGCSSTRLYKSGEAAARTEAQDRFQPDPAVRAVLLADICCSRSSARAESWDDDARCLLRLIGRDREARGKETEKCAGTWPAVGFLPRNAQQENEQLENFTVL